MCMSGRKIWRGLDLQEKGNEIQTYRDVNASIPVRYSVNACNLDLISKSHRYNTTEQTHQKHGEPQW